MERIVQVGRVFRNGERSATHHPEFTMLEWYRANAGYETLMDDCDGLLTAAAAAAGASAFAWGGRSCGPTPPAERLPVRAAFGTPPRPGLPAPPPGPPPPPAHAPPLRRRPPAP